MKLLLLALLPLAEAVVKPNASKEIPRASQHFLSHSYHNTSNAVAMFINKQSKLTLEVCPGHCDSGWTYFKDTDSCYKTFYWSSFNDAESLCKIIGGHLTSIHSLNENAFVADLAKTGLNWSDKNHLTWIGLRRADYLNGFEWFWTDGTPVDFLAWAPNEPDNSYGKERCVQSFYNPDLSNLFSEFSECKNAAEGKKIAISVCSTLYSDSNTGREYALMHQKWNDYTCTEIMRSFVCKKGASH